MFFTPNSCDYCNSCYYNCLAGYENQGLNPCDYVSVCNGQCHTRCCSC